ncbi:methyltransferase [Acidobacterium sp. S8]|uniref:methyltransferase n=1 Tax=Acidobacterium sp. S8 TaxID=1641854 RepID=UPI00131D55A4|nr:methyltransferase [Acidobacterium sp. S8]
MAQHTGGIGNVTPNTSLIEMAMAYSRSRVLCAAARLGIADALGDEVHSVGFLAEKCQADANALYRLLRALASIGVTEETTPEHFWLTSFGQPLRRDVPQSVWPAVIFWADLLADSWSLLTDCVRTGKPASQVRDPKIPSRWSQDPDASSIFRAVMGTAPAEDYAPVAAAWDFSRAKVVADLGGGGGSLILAVLALNPHLRGMLVDLESSVDAARTRFAEEDSSSRCELIAADLMQSVPAGADVYMLKHVLHGRRDAEAITILKNCRAVIPQNGSLLIIEFILPPLVSHADPQLEGHLMSDLNMLAVTGGKERSEREWKTLLEAAGFILIGVHPVGDDVLMVRNVGILEAKPALE